MTCEQESDFLANSIEPSCPAGSLPYLDGSPGEPPPGADAGTGATTPDAGTGATMPDAGTGSMTPDAAVSMEAGMALREYIEPDPILSDLRAVPPGLGQNGNGCYAALAGVPKELLDLLSACPVGKMQYCSPKPGPGIRCEKFTFNCVDFTNKLLQCLQNAMSVLATSGWQMYNSGAKGCCNISDGMDCQGHSVGIMCKNNLPTAPGMRSCWLVEGQCSSGNGTGARCGWTDDGNGLPQIPDQCLDQACPPGSYSDGTGTFPTASGIPTGHDGGSNRICRSLFMQTTGLSWDNPSPTPTYACTHNGIQFYRGEGYCDAPGTAPTGWECRPSAPDANAEGFHHRTATSGPNGTPEDCTFGNCQQTNGKFSGCY
jgi:hypothetical protein